MGLTIPTPEDLSVCTHLNVNPAIWEVLDFGSRLFIHEAHTGGLRYSVEDAEMCAWGFHHEGLFTLEVSAVPQKGGDDPILITPVISVGDGYTRFRGRCREVCSVVCEVNPTLTLTRGHYYCPIWNAEEPHWWTVRPDGTIHDPTRWQFPSRGRGIYTPSDGRVVCEQCGQSLPETEAYLDGHHVFCNPTCFGRCVGLL